MGGLQSSNDWTEAKKEGLARADRRVSVHRYFIPKIRAVVFVLKPSLCEMHNLVLHLK